MMKARKAETAEDTIHVRLDPDTLALLVRLEATRIGPQRGRNEILNKAEMAWISIGRSALGSRFTNATLGGEGALGYMHSEETRRRLSEKQLANAELQEWKEVNRKSRERATSEEARAKGLKTRELNLLTPKGRARQDRMNAELIARLRNPEAREKNSLGQKRFRASEEGRRLTIEQSEKKKVFSKTEAGSVIMANLVAKSRTPEANEKRNKTQRAQAATPEGRNKIMLIVEKSHAPEALLKLSATHKKLAQTPEGHALLEALRQLAMTQESRSKQSATRKELAKTPDGRVNVLKAAAASVLARKTEEGRARMLLVNSSVGTRAKQSATRKAMAQTPEGRQRCLEALKAGSTPEARAKGAATRKANRVRRLHSTG